MGKGLFYFDSELYQLDAFLDCLGYHLGTGEKEQKPKTEFRIFF